MEVRSGLLRNFVLYRTNSVMNSDTDVRCGRILGNEDKSDRTTWAIHINTSFGRDQIGADGIKIYLVVSDDYVDSLNLVSPEILLVNLLGNILDSHLPLFDVFTQEFLDKIIELFEESLPFVELPRPVDRPFRVAGHRVLLIYEIVKQH